MASLCELDIVALTDHNTAKNCPAFFKAAEKYGIVPIAGMELTTSEDIHIVCLFRQLDDAMRFSTYVDQHRIVVKNKPKKKLLIDFCRQCQWQPLLKENMKVLKMHELCFRK